MLAATPMRGEHQGSETRCARKAKAARRTLLELLKGTVAPIRVLKQKFVSFE
jgi:hypothetical protein